MPIPGLTVRRSLGTIIIGLSLIVVLIALPLLGLFVAINVYRRRRKLEPAFASWIAAMLFATIPIRNFLPGAPPPGSWIDIPVVLWVIIALIAALVFWAAGWWQAHPQARQPPPDPDGPVDAPSTPDIAATANTE